MYHVCLFQKRPGFLFEWVSFILPKRSLMWLDENATLTLFPTSITGVLWSASASMQTSARFDGFGDRVRLKVVQISCYKYFLLSVKYQSELMILERLFPCMFMTKMCTIILVQFKIISWTALGRHCSVVSSATFIQQPLGTNPKPIISVWLSTIHDLHYFLKFVMGLWN